MTTRFLRRMLMASAALVLTNGTAVWAADAPPADGAQSTTGAAPVLQEVIVQARRTNESQQHVPIAVSTVTATKLQDDAVTTVTDIQRLVPSLQVQQFNTGAENFTIRGSFNGVYNDPGVITYVDEVPVDARALVDDVFDLSSVQELKGPQGTLFGRNSTGGAVLFQSMRPKMDEFGGYIQGRYGNYDERRVEGAVNIPVGDTLAVRLAGEDEQRDGVIKSVTAPGQQYGDKNNYAIRASALWRPTRNVEDYFQYLYYDQHEHHYPYQVISEGIPASCAIAPTVCQQLTLPWNKTVNTSDDDTFATRSAVTNAFSVDLGWATVKNIFYDAHTNIVFNNDFDGTSAKMFDVFQPSSNDSLYDETQIFGKAFGWLDWRVGGVYSEDKANSVENTFIFLPLGLPPAFEDSRTDFKSKALFAQGTYDFSDLLKGLSLTAGYRYTWDDRQISLQDYAPSAAIPEGGYFPPPAGSACSLQAVAGTDTNTATCTRRIPLSFSSYNYNVTLQWQPTDRILLYASTRRGYKAGGFNPTITATPSITPQQAALLQTYQPEFNTDYELGLKADWRLGGMPIRTNVALFQENYTNIQLESVDVVGTSIIVLVTNQDPFAPHQGVQNKATIKGAEFEVTAAPTSWLQVSGFYSALDAKYNQAFNAITQADLSGQNINAVTPSTYGLTVQADFPMEGWAKHLQFVASYYGTGTPLSNATVPGNTQRAESIDMRASARDIFNTGADVAVYVKNLTGYRQLTVNPVLAPFQTVASMLTDPQTFGIELTYRFGGEKH